MHDVDQVEYIYKLYHLSRGHMNNTWIIFVLAMHIVYKYMDLSTFIVRHYWHTQFALTVPRLRTSDILVVHNNLYDLLDTYIMSTWINLSYCCQVWAFNFAIFSERDYCLLYHVWAGLWKRIVPNKNDTSTWWNRPNNRTYYLIQL